ncbi:MAG TPA: hypothetical protein DEH02_01340 [Bacteroidales bacterium]|nr:MAG: hypothetical protein A2X01_15030 [Bacteroidetes bacterium GWF2_35_48]OFZ00316.1 MAG: hypothetical protein A2491_04230 [Bacteroidetes bacterium RIFOXYC12_FULL_35_7]HBX49693.1 hypothetical protein [Bacteroidales bacterium]
MSILELISNLGRVNKSINQVEFAKAIDYLEHILSDYKDIQDLICEDHPALKELSIKNECEKPDSFKKYSDIFNKEFQINVKYKKDFTPVETFILHDDDVLLTIPDIEIIPLENKYDRVFCNGIAVFANKDKKYGLINLYGEIILPPVYDLISKYQHHDKLVFSLNGKSGLMDFDGNILVEPVYDYIIHKVDTENYSDYGQLYGYDCYHLIIINDNKFGLLDEDLKEIFPCVFKQIRAVEHPFSCYNSLSYMIIQDFSDKFAVYIPKYNFTSKFTWDDVYYTPDTHLPFKRDKQCGIFFINSKKEILLNFEFDLSSVHKIDPYFQIKDKEKGLWAVFDSSLKQLTKFCFTYPVSYHHYWSEFYIFVSEFDKFRLEAKIGKKEFFELFKLEK